MNKELHHVENPNQMRIKWLVAYILVAIAVMIWLYAAAATVKTRVLPVGKIELSVPFSKYLLGESISYSVKNDYNSPIYLPNNCPYEPLAVYRQESNKWVRVRAESKDDKCSAQPRQVSIPAKGIVSSTLDEWPDLFKKPGKYRLVAYVEFYNALPYQQFEIVKPPKNSSSNSNSGSGTSSNAGSVNYQGYESTSNNSTNTNSTPSSTKKSRTVSVAGAGSISVEYSSTTVYVTSIAPASGCTYEGGRSGTEVEVTFKCGGRETQIQLYVSGGQLKSQVETENGG